MCIPAPLHFNVADLSCSSLSMSHSRISAGHSSTVLSHAYDLQIFFVRAVFLPPLEGARRKIKTQETITSLSARHSFRLRHRHRFRRLNVIHFDIALSARGPRPCGTCCSRRRGWTRLPSGRSSVVSEATIALDLNRPLDVPS